MKKPAQLTESVIPAKAGIQLTNKSHGSSGSKSGMTKAEGFSSLATVAILGLLLALFLGLVGTGAVKLPGSAGIPVSPLPVSDPIEDDEACNDEFNADCEKFLENDPEDLTPAQIQGALKED